MKTFLGQVGEKQGQNGPTKGRERGVASSVAVWIHCSIMLGPSPRANQKETRKPRDHPGRRASIHAVLANGVSPEMLLHSSSRLLVVSPERLLTITSTCQVPLRKRTLLEPTLVWTFSTKISSKAWAYFDSGRKFLEHPYAQFSHCRCCPPSAILPVFAAGRIGGWHLNLEHRTFYV